MAKALLCVYIYLHTRRRPSSFDVVSLSPAVIVVDFPVSIHDPFGMIHLLLSRSPKLFLRLLTGSPFYI